MSYDPDKYPLLHDSGAYCPGCGVYLLFQKATTTPHPSGDGLSWECQQCGEQLHENAHGFVFAGEPWKETPVRPWVPSVVVPNPEGGYLVRQPEEDASDEAM